VGGRHFLCRISTLRLRWAYFGEKDLKDEVKDYVAGRLGCPPVVDEFDSGEENRRRRFQVG